MGLHCVPYFFLKRLAAMYHPQGKFIFGQIVMEKSQILLIFNEITYFRGKKRATFKKNQPQEKFIFRQLVLNIVEFWRNNSLFVQNKITHLKKI